MADTDQNPESLEPTSQQALATGKKKRSPIERTIVWGLIALALIVVLLEANARYGYSSTLESLQSRLSQADKNKGQELILKEAKGLVKGFPYGDERLTNKGKQLQYRWPSLFRTFAIELSTGVDDVVLSLETDVKPFDNEQTAPLTAKPFVQRQVLPEKGLSQDYENIPVLADSQFDSQAFGLQGILAEEIIRQAVYISARDELQLVTRDASLRGEVRLIENPDTFPVKLRSRISFTGNLDIELERPFKEKPTLFWESETIELRRESPLESLVEKTEALSRTGFVDFMKAAGYTGEAPEWKAQSTIPENTLRRLNEWNFISQYTVVQDIHAAIREDGETPERLSVLIRAYANLGSLTEIYWSPAHKVFKARALLYAERLKFRSNASAWALAHRAYARALSGLHETALDDIEAIRAADNKSTAKQQSPPEWTGLIEAYCAYQPEVLDKAVENDELKPLALYLRMLQADPKGNEKQMLAQTEELLKRDPECCRAMDRLSEVNALGIQRMVTEQRLDQLWQPLYQKLQEANLSNTARPVLQTMLPSPLRLLGEEQARMRIIDTLKSSPSTEFEPSENALGQLLQEVTFLHLNHKLNVRKGSLAVNVDDFLEQQLPLVKGHPYEFYIAAYTSDQTEAREAYKKLLNSYHPRELGIISNQLVSSSYYKLNQEAYRKLYSEIDKNVDYIYQDLLHQARWFNSMSSQNDNEHYLTTARRMLRVSPHMPETVAMNLRVNQEYAKEHAGELQKKYNTNALVLTALANYFYAAKDDAKTEEILKRRIELAPDASSYTFLANLYYDRGETEKWKPTIEKALTLPSFGLEIPRIHYQLANYHMQKGEWEEAKPHAVKAATSYSGWGLTCAANCYEGLGDLEQSETFVKACSKRYETSVTDWYFWCVRNKTGDLESARRLAEQQLLGKTENSTLSQRMQLGVYQIIQGSKSQAFETFSTAFRNFNNSYCGLHAALLAEDLELPAQRDDLLKQVAGQFSTYFGEADLANAFQRILQNPDSVSWNPVLFQSEVAQLTDGNPTNFYYFVGKFLEQRNKSGLSEYYLRLAATSPKTVKYNCALASHHLYSQNKKTGPRTKTEYDDSVSPAIQLVHEALKQKKREKLDEAIKTLDEALKLKPDLVIALVNRGLIHESQQNYSAAIADYKKAIEIEPDFWLPYNNLAYLLAGCEQAEIRDGAQALKYAQQSFDLLPTKYWVNYAALAVAFAESGQFKEAADMQRQASELAPESQKVEANRRWSLFNKGEPYRRAPEND
ncbi:tetratricopeptide repeat protein [Gimesia maris]|uniref:tetratricopeptide repeat protein n=1 Tax=Gimesia maris TaxID=122 RepID=UPI00241F0163|nr:tetratricopeptide repeat protein [Gimesia maris]|tara:strand:- start:238920 stop:242696 length:3777 start_codon:yes stop_codon:yes gene_type:complete